MARSTRRRNQVLQELSTGATFLVVSTHLEKGAENDPMRRTQMNNVVAKTRQIAADAGGIPVLYAGDYSSSHLSDALGPIMLAEHANDSYFAAQSWANDQYDTANNYRRVVSQHSIIVDRIFATPGIALRSWNQLLDQSHGHFTGVLASDHNAVYADLSVPSGNGPPNEVGTAGRV